MYIVGIYREDFVLYTCVCKQKYRSLTTKVTKFQMELLAKEQIFLGCEQKRKKITRYNFIFEINDNGGYRDCAFISLLSLIVIRDFKSVL